MKSVAIFNNKGGVGKTTFLCNLAAFLAMERSRRVLVIDADPQCNSTTSMFTDLQLLDFYEGPNAFTLHTVVKPLSVGKGFSETLHTERSPSFGVDVLIGDPSMSLTEDLLAADWVQATAGNIRGLRTTFLFSHLLSHCSEYDYVFFDMGPTLGAINRSVLIACDYFITPMSIDIFSLKAIDNMSVQLREWQRKLTKGLEEVTDKDELEVDDPRWKLNFLGYVTQQYKAKTTRGETRAVEAYDRIMKQVPKKVKQRLLEDSEHSAAEYHLGSIPLLHSLVPMSQTGRTPIFALQSSQGVRGAHFARVRDFRTLMGKIAEKFEAQVAKLSD